MWIDSNKIIEYLSTNGFIGCNKADTSMLSLWNVMPIIPAAFVAAQFNRFLVGIGCSPNT